jgi:Delta-aminolevulinic acid dehydratase
VAETSVRPRELVLPVFIKEGITEPQPIGSMPGVVQHTRDSLRKAAAEAAGAGVGGLIVFGIPAVKDGRGSAADDPAGISQLALADLRAEVGDDCVSSPTCACASTPITATAACSPRTATSATTPPSSGTPRSRSPRRRRARTWSRRAG